MATALTPDAAVSSEQAPPIVIGGPCQPTHLFPLDWTLADLQAHLGDIPANRLRLAPPPGFATEDDVVRLQEKKAALCELIDGVLVEKTMGANESRIASLIVYYLQAHVLPRRLGFVLAADGPVRTVAPQLRMPDVCFVSRQKCPGGVFPKDKVLPFAPDLAVEVLSESNTHGEMERKLQEYFAAGVRLAWFIDPEKRTARVYTSERDFADLSENDDLDGRDVLPGVTIRLGTLFDDVEGPAS